MKKSNKKFFAQLLKQKFFLIFLKLQYKSYKILEDKEIRTLEELEKLDIENWDSFEAVPKFI